MPGEVNLSLTNGILCQIEEKSSQVMLQRGTDMHVRSCPSQKSCMSLEVFAHTRSEVMTVSCLQVLFGSVSDLL